MKVDDLPNDIQKLKSLVLEKDQALHQKDQEIIQLKDVIQLLQRKKYAPSSESNKDQYKLFNELEELVTDIETESEEEITYKRKKRGKRKPLPDNLPRKETIIDIPEDQKEGMKLIGEEVSEKLHIKPAEVWVERIIRKKYAPIDDPSKKIVVADKDPELLPKTMASASLIAYIIIAKFVDALPLYRQEKIFLRISATLTRQTMARWLIKTYEQLIPLYNLLQDRFFESNYAQMDETTTQVLNEKDKKATTKSYMWVRHVPGENPIILYDYSPTRAGTVPMELLEGFQGILQVDGYDGYAPAIEKYKLIRVGCWDHARRKFYDALKTSGGKGIGKKGVVLIDKLYKIEKQIGKLPLEQKQQIRNEKARPILDELKAWADEIKPKITPKSVAGKAVNYLCNEWDYLVAYIDHPQVYISNALIENAIRPFAIGRRNWLFSASVDGAKASALFYSLIETAKANGLEPFDYFNKMLEKLPKAKTVEDFEALLPLKEYFKA